MILALMLMGTAQASTPQVARPVRNLPAIAALTAPKPEMIEVKLPSIPAELIDDIGLTRPDKRLWTLAPRPRGEWPSVSVSTGGPKIVYRHYHRAAHEERCPEKGALAIDLAAMMRRGFTFEQIRTLRTYVPLGSFPDYGYARQYYTGSWGAQFEISPTNRLIIRFPIAEKRVTPQVTLGGQVVPARYECQGGFAVDIWMKGPRGVDPFTGRGTNTTPKRNPMVIDKPAPRLDPVRPAGPAGPAPVIRDKPRR